jgi:hypothetical protein
VNFILNGQEEKKSCKFLPPGSSMSPRYIFNFMGFFFFLNGLPFAGKVRQRLCGPLIISPDEVKMKS